MTVPGATGALSDLPLPERALAGFVALSRALLSGPAVAPALLVCWPLASRNAYQHLLYSEALSAGFQILPIPSLEELEAISWPGPIVLHAHWFSSLYAKVKNADEAVAAGALALKQMFAFRARTGARLLWTAHNVLPHNLSYREQALALRRDVLASFDGVHLMADNHRTILEEAYGTPLGRAFVVPHPLYTSAYPDRVTRNEARAKLGIAGDERVALCFGALHAYKGFDVLLAAFRQLAGRADAPRLIVAGRPADATVAFALKAAAAGDKRMIVNSAYIPDEDIQYYFRAADALVLPYTDGLNSGAAWLGLTFRLPIVAPDTAAFLPVRQAGRVFSYPTNSADGLAHAISAALSANGQGTSDLSAHAPQNVSRDFFHAVRALLETTAGNYV